MASRREIREAAVQFLYGADLEDTSNQEVLYKTFWSIVLESDEKKLRKASAKALLHLNQGRESRYIKLVENAPAGHAAIKANPDAIKLSEMFGKILKQENTWQSLCDSVSRLMKSELESSNEELEIAMDEVFTANHVLIAFRKEYLKLIEDFPKLSRQIEAVTAQINALNRVSKRLLMIEEPESYPDQTDIAHLRSSAEKIVEYRSSVDAFVTGVLNNKEKIDAAISSVVENFKPERIDPVDRAAIRLATYEILFQKETPPAVAINEAIEIVKRFGSNESARFTNGILDTIAKNIDKK